MSIYLEVAKRCSLIRKSDRNLDVALALLTGWKYKGNYGYWGWFTPHWFYPSERGLISPRELIGYQIGSDCTVPFFTISLDAAVTLSPPDYKWKIQEDYELGGRSTLSSYIEQIGKADGFCMAAATCAAAMKVWDTRPQSVSDEIIALVEKELL